MDSPRASLSDSQPPGVQPRIWRSRNNQVLAGVVGGLAERLNVSPTGLRWFSAFGTFASGILPGVVVYMILWGITTPRSTPPRDPRST